MSVPNPKPLPGSELDVAGEADQFLRALREKLTEAETSLATTRSDLQRAQAGLVAAGQKQAALRAALREAQSAHETERAALETMLHKAESAHKSERATLKAALHEAQVAQRSEAALRHRLESSTAWRITWPIRRALTLFRSLPITLRRSLRLHDVEHGRSEERDHGRIATPKRDRPPGASLPPAQAPEVVAPTTTHDAPPTLPHLLSKRFRELDPLRVFHVPGDAPRVNLVTDSISAGSLFGGVGTALVMSALLARHLGARLRVITRTEPPEPGNVAGVLATHRIPWTGDIEFVHAGPRRKEEVPVGDHELFLTTSWWSTRCVLPIVDPRRLVYFLQEDERMLYAWGDDRLRCVETLSDPNIRFVINSRVLFDRLTQGPDALPNILAHGIWFEPAVPAFDRKIAEVDPVGGERQFFFYARPNNRRDLYWRGLEAIGAALEENVLDPAEWTFHVSGDLARIELPRGVRPNIVQNLPWVDYVKLVGRMDVGLCLMDTPHPNYPPLDLAASGAVVVTNKHVSDSSLASYSDLIECESSIEGLKRGIGEAAARTADRDRRQADLHGDHINRDWEVALTPVLARLYPNHRLG